MAGAVQRYCGGDGEPRVPHPEGEVVLFADIEEALHDSKRLAWLRPIIEGHGGYIAESRCASLAYGLAVGLTGNELVDYAMQRCPE